MHHAFLYISLPSLQDYNVKMPNFTFCRGHENKTTINFSLLPNLNTVFYTRKICQHLTNWTRLNKRDKIWSSANSLFKWRFRSRRRRCRWSSLMIKKYLLCVSHDVIATIFVSQTCPVGVELFCYVDDFFCSNKFAWMLATWVKTQDIRGQQ